MPKLFGLHEIELQPGVEPDEYERFFAEEVAPTVELQGWKTHLLRGDRGERAGKYLVLLEIESLEARDRYCPDRAKGRRSSLGSSKSTQKRPRQSRNGRKWAHSDRRRTFPPITSSSLSSGRGIRRHLGAQHDRGRTFGRCTRGGSRPISPQRSCGSLPKQIAEKSIRRSRSRRPRGRTLACSIGG